MKYILILLLIFGAANAQTPTLQQPNAQGGWTNPNSGAYGVIQQGLIAWKTLGLPTGNGAPLGTQKADVHVGLLYMDSTSGNIYKYNPKTLAWTALSSGGGGGTGSDTAHLNQGFAIMILNEDSTYKPNGSDVTIAVDTFQIHSYINQVISNDTTIGQIINNPAFIVKYKSNAPVGDDAEGDKYLVDAAPTGTFTGHANQIATKVGGVYTYETPTQGDQLILDNPITPTYAGFQFNGSAWQPTNVIVLAGGNSGIGSLQIGTIDAAQVLIKTKNTTAISIDTLQNVYLPKFTGLEDSNLFFKPGLNGLVDTGHFHQLIAGDNITIVGDTISSTGGSGMPTLFPTTGTGTATGDVTGDLSGNSLTANNATSITLSSGNNQLISENEGGFSESGTAIGEGDYYSYMNSAGISNHYLRVYSGEIQLYGSTEDGGLNLTLNTLDSSDVDVNNVLWVGDSNKVHRGHITAGGGGTTTNALTFNNSGSGDASGTTFNGSAARTLSYNSIGAVPATRSLTINGTALDLSADRSWTIPGTAATGNYGNLQLNRNSVFATPASDSLSFNSGTLTNKGNSIIKGTATITTTATGTAGTDSVLVQSGGLVKKISPAYYTDVIAGVSTQVAYFNSASQLTSNANYKVDATNGYFAIGNITPAARLHLGGNISAANSGTSGILLRTDANTITNTTSSGTVAFYSISNLGATTLAATSSTTYTEAATLRLDAPIAGTNVSVTAGNNYSLYVSGTSKFVGTVNLAGTLNGTGTNTLNALGAQLSTFGGTALTSGAGVQSQVRISPTITQTASGGYRALWIPVFENTLGSSSAYLIDAGTSTAANGGGTYTSKFIVDSKGVINFSATTTPAPATGYATLWFDGTNIKMTKNVSGTTTTSTIF